MKKFISLIAMLTIFSCGTDLKNTGTINTAIKVDIDSTNPYKFLSSATTEIMLNVYEGLVSPSEDGEVKPAIAKSYEISEDAKKYIFEIRDDVVFHNGEKLEISDVVFSLNKMKELKLQKVFLNIESVEADGNKVIVNLFEPDTSLIYYLTTAIVQEKSFDTLDKKENGTGAYTITEYNREQNLVFESFDKYYGAKPQFSKINIDVVPSVDTSFLNLLSGKYNLLSGIDQKRVNELKDKYTIVSYPQNMMFIMGINNDKYDAKIRQALISAINVDEIIEKSTYGYATKLSKDKVNGDKSLIEGKTFTLKVPLNDKIYIDVAQIIKEQMKKYNVNINIVQQEWASWLQEVYINRDYELTLIGLAGKLDRSESLRRFVSDYSKNFISFNNKEYDKVYNEAKLTVDEKKRAELYDEAYDILLKNYASAFIMDPSMIVAMDKNISNYSSYKIPFINFSTLKIGD